MYMRSSLLKFAVVAGLIITQAGSLRAQDAGELYNTATGFMRSGDYSNAILVLNQALQLDPDNFEYRKQLGFSFYLKGDLNKAKTIIEPLLSRKDADIQVFQIAGNIYQGKQEWKTAQRMYEKALRKFPESGELYNDNGNLLMTFKMFDAALRSWLKGIEKDPGFPGNYYNAARTYNYSKEPLWAILYGETFMNMESFTTRTAEIRSILMESYKRFFNDPSLFDTMVPDDKKGRSKSGEGFTNTFKQAMGKQMSVVTGGIDTDALIMLRTRFLLEWYNFNGHRYPYALFDYQQQLLKKGLFESYNQWLFGPAASPNAYKAWTALHKQEYDEFGKFQRNQPLKPRPDEYYNDGKFTLSNAGY